MTYWAREHEHNLRRIDDIMRELEHAYEDIIPALKRDLADDDHDATEDARAALTDARTDISQAMGSLERAKASLPKPVYRIPAHPTAADVMERDA